ncbi:glycosyltransferase [Desulfocurvibacter africanus]|uniref:glycosyltransferase n=1 Tax=Desulfocurvibacter africanus TaxID=873 RepID=UPI000426852E|nr:glycosyltransferase [Desulfocurvibacter africanus]
MTASALTVTHHTCLEQRGGAARVADMLAGWQAGSGMRVGHTFELAETEAGRQRQQSRIWLDDLRDAARSGGLVHLHATRDWPALLEGLAGQIPPLPKPVLTLHDCALLTGGCIYILNCPHYAFGCVEPCPRSHGQVRERREHIEQALRSLSPLAVSPSRWLRDLAAQRFPWLDLRVVPNGVEWPEARPDKVEARRRLGLAAEARLTLFVAHGGTSAAWKGGDIWMDMFKLIKTREPRAVACMLGGEKQERRGDVFLWPYVDRERMTLFLTAADVLVYPSRADNHPLIVLEAMAAGTCVAATAVGGIPEQIRDGETGALVRGDWLALAERTATLLAHPRQTRTMGINAFETGRARFSLQRMAADYLRVYAQAVAD